MQRDVVLATWNCLLNPKENGNNNSVLVPIAVEYDSWVFFFFFWESLFHVFSMMKEKLLLTI